MRTAALLAVALGLSTVAAPVPKALRVKSDAELLKGQWVSVSRDNGTGPMEDDGYWLVVGDGKMLMGHQSGRQSRDTPPDTTFALETTTSPKQIDIHWPNWKEPDRGVYTVDHDTFRFCTGGSQKPRPAALTSESDGWSIVFKRVRDN